MKDTWRKITWLHDLWDYGYENGAVNVALIGKFRIWSIGRINQVLRHVILIDGRLVCEKDSLK